MIELRTSLTIERRRKLKILINGGGREPWVIRPVDPGREFVTLVLGEIERGQIVNPNDVLKWTRHLLCRVGEQD